MAQQDERQQWSAELVKQVAYDVFLDFVSYNSEFRSITQRAKIRFERREWAQSQLDAVERIELWDNCVNATVARMRETLGETPPAPAFWQEVKARFARIIHSYRDIEFTRTYFNSVVRRMFYRSDASTACLFGAERASPMAAQAQSLQLNSYTRDGSLTHLFTILLADYAFAVTYRDIGLSGEQLARAVARGFPDQDEARVSRVDMIRSVFFRDTRAYLVGRVRLGRSSEPIIIALKNTEQGIVLDAVVMDEYQISTIFGFARSYFHVDEENVTSLAVFLKLMLPLKNSMELFTMLGRAKQAKTQRYRDIMHRLQVTNEVFEDVALDRGMVMIVFTLPSYDGVFKVIRDQFAYPKTTVREDVLEKYHLVFTRDRVGRLVEAQEFKRLRFPRERFDPGLLEELVNEAGNTVTVEPDDTVLIRHAYVERRLIPLNQYLRDAQEAQAIAAVLEYGQAIRDLAAANIFPGDLLLKNFGVSGHGRVIFYDYDELCLVTECNFRDMVQPQFDEDEMRAGEWFYVADNDIFPEQFSAFLGFDGLLREAFMREHSELLTAAWWRQIKTSHEQGEIFELVPYRPQPFVY